MKINTALILCAGYGKRLNPLTLEKPKPLLKINEITLLENCINLIKFAQGEATAHPLMTAFYTAHASGPKLEIPTPASQPG